MTSTDVVYVMQRPGCIAIGQSGEICKITDSMVAKYPKSFPGETTYNELRQQFLDVERFTSVSGTMMEFCNSLEFETGAITTTKLRQSR